MLERAKACLQSGARESVRCATRATRSTRLLHSTFWNHGAGDLDLPPWASIMYPMPSDLPLKDGSKARGGKSKQSARTTPGDGVFLDFLYPPQALAMLSRAQFWERWERRNARRLPDGFIQTSRGYASRAYSQATAAGALNETEEAQGYKRGEAMKKLGMRGNIQDSNGFVELEPDVAMQEPVDANKDTSAGQDEAEDESGFFDSPLESAEAGDSVDRMWSIIRRSRSTKQRTTEVSQKVLRLYDELDEGRRNDVRLKIELLDWLSSLTDNDAEVRCADLYRSIPLQDRTLQVYQAALNVFLRRGQHIQAFNLLKEALTSISNGDQVAKDFFAYAINGNRWQLAMNIETSYHLAHKNMSGMARNERFWFHVSRIPRLLPQALALLDYLKDLQTKRLASKQNFCFCAKFFREALLQEFQASDQVVAQPSFAMPTQLPSAQIGQFFALLTSWTDEPPRFYESMIMSMIRPKGPYSYELLHATVSRAYHHLKDRFATHAISQQLLLALLSRLLQYSDPFGKLKIHRTALTVDTLAKDWIKWSGRLSKTALASILQFAARNGHWNEYWHWFEYLKSQYPSYEEQKSLLWTEVYFHARRGDLSRARDTFNIIEKTAEEHSELPPVKCCNVLIHAYARADDLHGAVDLLLDLIDKGFEPDAYSLHPIMELQAKRGDVEGVRDMLAQYDALVKGPRPAHLYGSLLTALTKSGDMEEADEVLKTLVEDVVKHENTRGSLTPCFNIVLTAHALRRDVNATMSTYQWMKSLNISADADTFGALIQALTAHRQTHSAWAIVRHVMRKQGIKPTSFHYALVMIGYINQDEYAQALRVHEDMMEQKIRPSFSAKVAYLKAKALYELRERREAGDCSQEPLHSALSELQRLLETSDGSEIAAHERQAGAGRANTNDPSDFLTGYFQFLIQIHGKQQCFDVVRQLVDQWKAETRKRNNVKDEHAEVKPPIQLLSALMSVYFHAGQHEEVERYWKLVKEQADGLAERVPVPLLSGAGTTSKPQAPAPDLLDTAAAEAAAAAQEVGFQTREMPASNSASAPSTNVKQPTTLSSSSPGPTPPEPVVGRAHVLSRPLRIYLYALANLSRFHDMITVVSQVLHQGYIMDNKTWNVFICLLCEKPSTPLTTLAFVLTERFLLPFAGWNGSGRRYLPNRSDRTLRFEYMRVRYMSREETHAQYRTIVFLGAALLKLRREEIMGRGQRAGGAKKKRDGEDLLEKYIGSVVQVRKMAPRALLVVQSMPRIDEKLQNRVLRSGV
jgi:pentatricopeptide repeat-containing protein PET309